MDPRLTPANGRVAAAHLKGQVQAEAFVAGEARRVAVPLADLLDAPEGRRQRQVLLGEAVTVYEQRAGWAFVQAAKDGYVGYLRAAQLGEAREVTHWVAVLATHAYAAADMKSPDLHHLSFGARVSVVAETRKFFETAEGWFLPSPHLWPLDKRFADPVTAAQLHFGVPYLWGGNSALGIDCSGLVQAALVAAGRDCPGDSDLQAAVGEWLAEDVPPQRGDLWFWKGHVGLLADAGTLLHANAHHMAVAYEPLAAAVARIAAQGDGPVTARRRLPSA